MKEPRVARFEIAQQPIERLLEVLLAAAAHDMRSVHFAKACGQRGLNLQPSGRLISEGGEPAIDASLACFSRSSRGIEPRRPHVYGCCGS